MGIAEPGVCDTQISSSIIYNNLENFSTHTIYEVDRQYGTDFRTGAIPHKSDYIFQTLSRYIHICRTCLKVI